MEKLNQVISILNSKKYNPIIKTEKFGSSVFWTDEKGDQCSIFEQDITVEDHKIAWFQTSQKDNHVLKVYDNGSEFTWVPRTYNPVFGCICLVIEWYKSHLLFIYQEKHDIYICSVKNNAVKYVNFDGYELGRQGDFITYDTYTNRLPDQVRLLKIPELIELDPIGRAEAEKRGLLPKDVHS